MSTDVRAYLAYLKCRPILSLPFLRQPLSL